MSDVIPIFVIVHNQFEILKKSVESYEKYIQTPFKIIFHDVASTYPDTLNYLKEKNAVELTKLNIILIYN